MNGLTRYMDCDYLDGCCRSLQTTTTYIDIAGASPNQASPEHIGALDMVGTGHAVDAFRQVMAEGGEESNEWLEPMTDEVYN